jgi:hypothetical protein
MEEPRIFPSNVQNGATRAHSHLSARHAVGAGMGTELSRGDTQCGGTRPHALQRRNKKSVAQQQSKTDVTQIEEKQNVK